MWGALFSLPPHSLTYYLSLTLSLSLSSHIEYKYYQGLILGVYRALDIIQCMWYELQVGRGTTQLYFFSDFCVIINHCL